MRKVSLAFPVVFLVAVCSVSAIGQQSPVPYPVPGTESTLADAARTNNYPLFDALFMNGGPDAARFAELHAFWKWSMTDPVGAFYGDAMHAKFAREYPDYAESIADYGIVDANGRAFYPSAETRKFLLKHALDGTAPVAVRVADHHGAPKHIAAPVVAEKLVSRALALDLTPAVVVAQAKAVPLPHAIAVPKPEPAPAPQAPASDDRVARGFALIVAGLVAIGMLTLMFRTPKETA